MLPTTSPNKYYWIFLVLVLFQSFFGCVGESIRPDQTNGSERIIIYNVNLLSMKNDRLLESRTLVVEKDRIRSIGKKEDIQHLGEALWIDGRGAYLLPGLSDMHVHLADKDELERYLAFGITQVRNMWGHSGVMLWFGIPNALQMKKDVLSGNLTGPMIYTAGEVLEGKPNSHFLMMQLTDPDSARFEVQSQYRQGYDFVKVYDSLSPEVYSAILQESEKLGIPVAGHKPKKVDLELFLEGSQTTIEHLTAYLDPDSAELLFPEDQLDQWAEKTKLAGIYNCPTLVLYPQLSQDKEFLRQRREHPGNKHLGWFGRFFQKMSHKAMIDNLLYREKDYPEKISELNRKVVAALHRKGAKLILGTDSGNPFVFPGYAVHEEIGLLSEAGLSNYDILLSATVHAAESVGEASQWGTLEPGKLANMILVEKNPLLDLSTLREPLGVMVMGRWIEGSELKR